MQCFVEFYVVKYTGQFMGDNAKKFFNRFSQMFTSAKKSGYAGKQIK